MGVVNVSSAWWPSEATVSRGPESSAGRPSPDSAGAVRRRPRRTTDTTRAAQDIDVVVRRRKRRTTDADRAVEAVPEQNEQVVIEPLTKADVAAAVKLAVPVLRVRPGDRAEQFAADITGEQRQMFVAKANRRVVAYGRVIELAADEAGPGTPTGYYLSGVLVVRAWRGRGIGAALTPARLSWAFARTERVFYVTGADNSASLHLHAGLGFQEVKRFESERSAAGLEVLSQLVRKGDPDVRPQSGGMAGHLRRGKWSNFSEHPG